MDKLEIKCNWFCVTAAFCIFTLLLVVDYPILYQMQNYRIIANNEKPMKEAELTYFIVLTQLHLWISENLVKDFQYMATTQTGYLANTSLKPMPSCLEHIMWIALLFHSGKKSSYWYFSTPHTYQTAGTWQLGITIYKPSGNRISSWKRGFSVFFSSFGTTCRFTIGWWENRHVWAYLQTPFAKNLEHMCV